jgi:pilus assembly protein CpaF
MAVDLPLISIQRQVASAIDIIVQISRLPGGKRGVTQISEVTDYDDQRKCVATTDIFSTRDQVRLVPTGYMPSFIDQLISRDLLKLEFLYGEQT